MVKLRSTTANGLTLPFELLFEDKSSEDKNWDLKTEIFDKAGSALSQSLQCASAQQCKVTGAENIQGGDVLELIISFLMPRSLALASCVSKKLRKACSRDEVWMLWLQKFWDAADQKYYGSKVQFALLKAYLDLHHASQPLHQVYIARARARRRVRGAWMEVRKFAGVRGMQRILPPVSESDALDLEQRYGCKLPLELRELYLVANGEREGWGLEESDGLADGLRMLPLEEALTLRAAQPGGRLVLPPSREGNTCELDVLPVTALSGIGFAGERYVVSFDGQVYKASGMSVYHVGTVSEFLLRLVR